MLAGKLFVLPTRPGAGTLNCLLVGSAIVCRSVFGVCCARTSIALADQTNTMRTTTQRAHRITKPPIETEEIEEVTSVLQSPVEGQRYEAPDAKPRRH